MNRLHHSSHTPSRSPRKPLSKLAWIAPLVASAVAAAHLLFPSVKEGEHPSASAGASSPAARFDAVPRSGLLPDLAISHIVRNRLAHSEEPEMRGASFAAYDR